MLFSLRPVFFRMICDSNHTVIVATIGSQCTFTSQLHWMATTVHIKCACCHLDSIFMWQIECEHTICYHSAYKTVWQTVCTMWQPNLHIKCFRCHTYALHAASVFADPLAFTFSTMTIWYVPISAEWLVAIVKTMMMISCIHHSVIGQLGREKRVMR